MRRTPHSWIFPFVVTLLASMTAAFGEARASMPVKVLVPDGDNLQYMSFWVAKAAGFFTDDGVDIELVVPPAPQQTLVAFREGKADVAVLPPPVYLQLVAEKHPFSLVANLLQNDPIDLVVRKSVADERNISPPAPLGDRLRALHGLKIGVAPHPPTRLRTLFSSQGLDADREVEIVILRGPEQNAAFAQGRVDALYAHTPYLETALVDQDATLVVNQSAGETPALAARQIHALCVTHAYRDGNRVTVAKLVHAVARAEELLRADHARAVDVLAHEFPEKKRAHLEKIVALYAPAIPVRPDVSPEGFAPALALFPAGQTPPDLRGIELDRFVDRSFAPADDEARAATRHFLGRSVLIALGIVAAVALLLLRGGKRPPAS